jgi:hypothetical protein
VDGKQRLIVWRKSGRIGDQEDVSLIFVLSCRLGISPTKLNVQVVMDVAASLSHLSCIVDFFCRL